MQPIPNQIYKQKLNLAQKMSAHWLKYQYRIMFNFISQNISPLKAQALLKLNARVPIVATPQLRCPSAPLSEKKPNDDGDDEDGYDDGDGGYDDGQDVFVCKNISFSMNLNIYEYFSMSILFRNSIILI